jgi:cell division protein FtsW (lipid II flippase)
MELFDTLASVGLTTRVLQILVIVSIVVVIAGIFWRYIVVGVGILFCVVVFAMPSKSDKPVTEVKTLTLPEYKIESAPSDAPEVKAPSESKAPTETKVQSDESMFLEDCGLYSGYTQSQCKALWESDKAEIQKSNWKYKSNQAYMKKIKYVL